MIRFSLLTLLGVMTAVAVLLGMPGYVYGVVGLLILTIVALAAFVMFVQAPLNSAADFLQMFASRRRLEDYDNPPFSGDPPANAKPHAENHGRRQTISDP